MQVMKKKHDPKVFCIGFSKTGTTSLNRALGILGYRNVHWLRGHIEPSVGWVEYIKRSPFDAFSDAPMYKPGLFKKIDKELPSSKFILTVRNTDSLIKSWTNYFMNAPWSIDTDEDKEVIATMYEHHVKDVVTYFEKIPNQLLIFDIIGGDSWQKLCEFLEEPIPDVPFPHKRKARYKKK